MPYHCVPLFAALDRVASIGPRGANDAQRDEEGLDQLEQRDAWPPDWTQPGTWVILDLPGPRSVALATRLCLLGMQPVCTFDHWPHRWGLLKPEAILAQLLRQAPLLAEAREGLHPGMPPLWICDSERFGVRPGRPTEFDNRYFLDDSILPGRGILKEAGIHRVLYVRENVGQKPEPDVNPYLAALMKHGFQVQRVDLEDEELIAQPFAPAQPLNRKFSKGFMRNAAGGFGRLIPDTSSGGGG